MNSSIEIERAFILNERFLSKGLRELLYDKVNPYTHIIQYYFMTSPRFETRMRAYRKIEPRNTKKPEIHPWKFELTVKIKLKNNSRREINFNLPKWLGNLISNSRLLTRHELYKERYIVPQKLWPGSSFKEVIIDRFPYSDNPDLRCGRIEIEFYGIDHVPIDPWPSWIGDEITGLFQYSNYAEAGITKQKD